MMKKRLWTLFTMAIMTGIITSCGSTNDSAVEVINQQETTITPEDRTQINNTISDITADVTNDTVEITEETEIIYNENDIAFIVTDEAYMDKTFYDGQSFNNQEMSYVNKEVTLTESIKIYNYMKMSIGYSKPNITMSLKRMDSEWSYLEKGTQYFYCRTQDLNKLTDITVTENTSDEETGNNILVNENIETQVQNTTLASAEYTVTEMSAVKYATQQVNLRSGPSTSYDVVGSLSANQEVTITGQADNGWYRVTYNGGSAFVSNKYLSDTKAGGNTSSNATNTAPNVENSGTTATVPPTTVTQAPSTVYSESETIAIVRSVLESNNITWYPSSDSYARHPEFGLNGGLSWAICPVSLTSPNESANEILFDFNFNNWNMYYIESQGISGGYLSLKVYYGTHK